MTPISFCIPSRNNFKYIKFAYENIRECWPKDTELILLDDFSSDETWTWMNHIKKIDQYVKIYRHNGPGRVGHCVLYDIGASMISNRIFSIFHADMVPTKNYINNILKHLNPGTVVSATRIEPPLHPPDSSKIVENFGLEPEKFELDKFNCFVENLEMECKNKTTNGIFAPWSIFLKDFKAIGGHDKRVFAPMELEDSDLFNRFLLNGYTLVQSRDAFVYHMTCRGSRFKDGVKIVQEIPVGPNQVWKRAADSEEYTKLRQIKFRDWWRKWHMDVLHDSNMMPIVNPRYNVGFVVDPCPVPLLPYLEPWCDTIYTNLPPVITDDYIAAQQEISKFDMKRRIRPITEEPTNDIVIRFDGTKFVQQHLETLKQLPLMIKDSGELGIMEFDIFTLDIRKLDQLESHLVNADDPWYVSQLL